MWPHEKPKAHFTSHRLLLDNLFTDTYLSLLVTVLAYLYTWFYMSDRHRHGTSTSTSNWSYMRMWKIWEFTLKSILELWFEPHQKCDTRWKNVIVSTQLVTHKSISVYELWGFGPISFKDVSLLCLFLDPHHTSCRYWYLIKRSDWMRSRFFIDKLVWHSNWYAMSSRGIIYYRLRTLELED